MAFATIDQPQRPAPTSLDDEDFEVIDSGQSISPYEMSLLPPQLQQSPPREAGHVSTTAQLPQSQPQPQPDCQTEPTSPSQLLQQLLEAQHRFASLQSDLASNNHLLQGLSTRLHQQRLSPSPSQKPESGSSANSPQPAQDVTDGGKDSLQTMCQELTRLRNQQEEWQQTREDYSKLKSQYGLLINTRERLEEERDELSRRIQQQQQQRRNESATVADETGKAKADADEMRQRICQLEATLQEKIHDIASLSATNMSFKTELLSLETTSQESNKEVAQLTQKIKELSGELDLERAKLFEQDMHHKDSLTDLRVNSNVRELERLRAELEAQRRRESEQRRLYGDSDQAVNDIIREAEAKRNKLEQQLGAMEASLIENTRRTEALVNQEMTQRERADELQDRLNRQMKDHLAELHCLQEKLSQSKQAHRRELEFKMQLADDRLKTLSTESDRTVNDILATAETEKQTAQKQLNDQAARLAIVEEQLRRRSDELAGSTQAVANLQRHSDELQRRRQTLEEQLADCRAKCNEACNKAESFRNQCDCQSKRIVELESNLAGLEVEHLRLRTDYNEMHHRFTETLEHEHTWQQKASEAQATMEEYARSMGNCQRAFEREVREKESLQRERDQLRLQANRVHNAFENNQK